MAGNLLHYSESLNEDILAGAFLSSGLETRRPSFGGPSGWADLVDWPVQCGCSWVARFSAGILRRNLTCPQCFRAWFSPDLGLGDDTFEARCRLFGKLIVWPYMFSTSTMCIMGEQSVKLWKTVGPWLTRASTDFAEVDRFLEDVRQVNIYKRGVR